MTFDSLKQTHQELFQNPELSEHNKKVLNEFFRKQRSGGSGKATLSDYASRFNSLAPHIDFRLDEAEQRDIEKIIGKFNQDDIRKSNGDEYSDHSKAKFWKTLSVFYRSFIKEEGKGFNEDIDGPELLEDSELRIDPVTKVEPESKARPHEILKMAEAASTLRDKVLIIFGWSTGCRIGEIAVTQYDPDPIKWKHIKFKDGYMEVKISEQGKDSRGKTGERTIPVRIGMPLVKRYYEQEDPKLDDPIFTKNDASFFCPQCNSKVDRLTNASYQKRRYGCKDCDWTGKTEDVRKRMEPLTDDAIRKMLGVIYNRSSIQREIDYNPHALFRKSRGLHKAAIGRSEAQLRSFFGWSENSDAPQHYITIMKEGLVSALKQEFGDDVIDKDLGFSEYDSMKPVECQCGELNSSLNDYCRSCDRELDEELMKHNKTEEEINKQETERLLEDAEDAGYTKEEFREIVRGVAETL